MGKGKPAPRETASEKKTKPQRAVSSKPANKSVRTAPAGRKASTPKTKTAVPAKKTDGPATAQKSEARTERQQPRATSTARASSKGAAQPSKSEAVKPEAGLRSAPQEVEPLKPAAEAATPQPARETRGGLQSERGSAASSEVAVAAEPGPEPDELDGVKLPAARGKVGVFGGPRDRSVKPDDKLALPTGRHYQFEQFRSLNPKEYYCAMRWEYRQHHMSTEEGKRWWANKRISVTNPNNNKSVVVRAVDYGPHEASGLTIAISPAAAEAIGVEPGQEVVVAFADEKAKLGPPTESPGYAS